MAVLGSSKASAPKVYGDALPSKKSPAVRVRASPPQMKDNIRRAGWTSERRKSAQKHSAPMPASL